MNKRDSIKERKKKLRMKKVEFFKRKGFRKEKVRFMAAI